MKNILFLVLALIPMSGLMAQNQSDAKTLHNVEIDPIVPLVLHGVGAHYMFKPSGSRHFTFGFAVIAAGKMPDGIINMNSSNKNKGWNYKINQGFGAELEYYYKTGNKGWFNGLQLFTQEINLTNNNVPEVSEHRTNTGMVVLTGGYKFYIFGKNHLYLKPWAGVGYNGVIKGAFSDKVIPNLRVGNYEYVLNKFSPFATVHVGYTF